MIIAENLDKIKTSLLDTVTLVAVSKTKSIADILIAYEAGQRDFGENKVQEMVQKYDALPKDIRWHMIGHLQRNKIKYMAHFVHLIHGVDSIKTLKEIAKQAKKHNRTIRCLLQVKIAKEETKFGLDYNEIRKLITSEAFSELENIKVVGLMGMATFTDNEEQIRSEFNKLHTFFNELQDKGEIPNFYPKILSMGMSGDYKIAMEEGSTMIRVGSAIFGVRNYI